MPEFNYFELELREVVTTPGNKVRVKFMGDVGESRWLSLTPEQFEKIEKLMIEIYEED